MLTVAVVDDEFSEVLSPTVGAARGFNRFYEVDNLPVRRRDDSGTADLAIQALREIDNKQKFFMWVHFFGPHSPNRIHKGIRLDGDSTEDGYEHEVRFADLHVGRLLKELQKVESTTAIFVVADHGEVFKEGQRDHGLSLDENGIRIPMLARVPGWKKQDNDTLVSLIDLAPTILDLTQTRVSKKWDGVSLRPVIETPRVERRPRILITETWQYSNTGVLFLDQIGAFDGKNKVVYDRINRSFIRYSQTHPNTTPQGVPSNTLDPLQAYLGAYIEGAGGAIDLQD
jgi:hypothetical protein